jgi:sporulation protein YlmC with PRC-barrel domain
MLRTVSDLKGINIAATDGDIGGVKDLYFDDLTWTVRYLVVDTGSWLPGRQVLISPISVRSSTTDRVFVGLTKAEVENSPSIDTDKPVNRQHEVTLSRYYRYPSYWEGPYRWGTLAYPDGLVAPVMPLPLDVAPLAQDTVAQELEARERESADPALRSARDVTGYYIEATDGDIGHVEDFLIDDREWAIRYIIVGTRNWWPGKKVVISPDWIRHVSWRESKVHVDLTREGVKTAPEYDPDRPVEREYETRLFRHHGRRNYWE